MYCEQTAVIKRENRTSDYIEIKRGVCKGRVLSPDLFNLCGEQTLTEIKDDKDLVIQGIAWTI